MTGGVAGGERKSRGAAEVVPGVKSGMTGFAAQFVPTAPRKMAAALDVPRRFAPAASSAMAVA